MESFDYEAELLAPDLVKLLSSKLNDVRKALLDSTQENEVLRERLQKRPKHGKNDDASREQDEQSEVKKLKLELAQWIRKYEDLQGELAGTRIQLEACVERMGSDARTQDIKPHASCMSQTCSSRERAKRLEGDIIALTDRLTAQQTSHEEQDAELCRQIEKYKTKYKKYKEKVLEQERNQECLDIGAEVGTPGNLIHEPCFHKSWSVGTIHKEIHSLLHGSLHYFRRGMFLPYNDRYDEALMVGPATRCRFLNSADTTGSWSPMTSDLASFAGTTREVLYLTDKGTCYAGTFLCASLKKYSVEEFRDLDVSIQEMAIASTVLGKSFSSCSISQQNMIRRKYRDGSIRAVYLHFTYQSFNRRLFEKLKSLNAQEELRREEMFQAGLKRKAVEYEGATNRTKKSRK